MRQTKPNQPRPPSTSRATLLGLGIVALIVIALVLIVVISTSGPTSSNQTSGGDTTSTNPTSTDSSNNPSSVLDPRFGTIPQPISPADNTVLSSLDPITFTWQRVSNIDAHYNLQLQYSDDGSTWRSTQTVYDLLSPKYAQRTPFLAAKLVRWRVWPTVNQQDGEASDWFTIQLPSK